MEVKKAMIQPIVTEDLPELQALYEELIGEGSNLAQVEAVYQKMRGNEAYHLLGYKVDGVLAGSVMGILCHDLVGSCKPFMVVENVIVSSRFQGHGVGKKLMLAIEKIANANECGYIMFVSSAYRKEAHQFYASLGYALDGVQGFRKML